MKVTPPINSAIQNLNSVQSRREGEGGAAQNSYERMFDQKGGGQHHKNPSESPPPHEEAEAVSDAVVLEVLNLFNADSHIVGSGIHAELEGKGSTLSVILHDASGQVLRRLTGPEFVRLSDETRETKAGSIVPVGLRRGKLFDQKA